MKQRVGGTSKEETVCRLNPREMSCLMVNGRKDILGREGSKDPRGKCCWELKGWRKFLAHSRSSVNVPSFSSPCSFCRSMGAGQRLTCMRGTGPVGWSQLEGQGGRLSLQAQAPR